MFYNQINSGAIQLHTSNIDSILAKNEFVFINFYSNWCRFSTKLAPIWDDAAEKINKDLGSGKIVVGKVDCDTHGALVTRFNITKYPTFKYFQYGQLAKREYRGKRSADAFLDFVKEQTKDPVKEFKELKDLAYVDGMKQYIIGYFEDRNSLEYANFRKSAMHFKDDCVFHVRFGEIDKKNHTSVQSIVAFRPNQQRSAEEDEIFKGNLQAYDEINTWVDGKCSPLIREITFENAEELTEEGLPFLILFHRPDDTESVKQYLKVVANYLIEDKQKMNFLIADGEKFEHPLHHLGKSKDDLPLIAIDSFVHMYLFPKFEDMHVPGRLKQFLQDFYSRKLHRDFHYGVEQKAVSSSSPAPGRMVVYREPDKIILPRAINAAPPPSQFANLGPSRKRYTFLHDEL